jgi:hypothetical protein
MSGIAQSADPIFDVLPVVPRLRACRPALVPIRPPARWCGGRLGCAMQHCQPGLTVLSDQPFHLRDIQFDNPQVGILALSPLQVLVK